MRWLLISALAFVAAATGAIAAAAQERGALTVPLQAETPGAAMPGPAQIYARSYALVIGINGYKDRAWPRLSNAVKDAEAVKAALERHGFAVTLKTELGANDLPKAIEDFIYGPGADKDARLLIWFAGHGFTLNEEGYLVPADAPGPAAGAEFRRKALSLRRFGEYMRAADAKHVLAIFDSCFAGTVFDTARAPPPAAITRATTLTVRQMISSGEASQQVSDNGTFRRLFIDALDGNEPNADANRDGFITGTELGLFLADKVANLTRNGQTPRYGKLRDLGYDRGDFVFQVGSAQGAVLPEAGTKKQSNPVPSSAPQSGWSTAEREWQQYGRDSRDAALIEAFKRKHKDDPVYVALADARLALLRREEQAAALAKTEAGTQKPKVAEQKLAAAQTPTPAPAKRPAAKAAAPATAAIGETFRDCADCPELVVVPAGSFMMGSPAAEKDRSANEGPQRRVTIAKPFAVGKFEVTFAEWDVCVAEKGCTQKPETSWGRGRQPVHSVSWDDAKQYVAWLSKKSGQSYRLLTEAEWEYAARAGTTTRYSFGDSITKAQAQFSGNSLLAHSKQSRLAISRPMSLACTTCMATSGSGSRIATHDSYSAQLLTGQRSRDGVTDAWPVSVRGGSWPAITRATSAPPSATGTPPTTGSTAWASGSGGRLTPDAVGAGRRCRASLCDDAG